AGPAAPTSGASGPVPLSRAARLPVPPEAQPAVVVRHVDGDTVVLRGDASGPLRGPARVRLLHIDTPEVFEERECYGSEAAARSASLLPVGSRVRVLADVDPLDRFGRALLLVWDDQGRSVQEQLLREGAARVLVVGPNRAGLAALRDAERQARTERLGLWGRCGG
ncbi:MAG: thermonuclease family protein, partial [Actinomycetota bacterium]|nr:thermonuclease family protein [Actinomycetota bacterium]